MRKYTKLFFLLLVIKISNANFNAEFIENDRMSDLDKQLFHAVIAGNVDEAQLVIDHKADVNMCDFDIKSGPYIFSGGVIDWNAVFFNAQDQTKIRYGTNSYILKPSTLLMIAIQHNQTNIVQLLLKSRADAFKVLRKSRLTPLMLAVQNQNIDIVRMLIKEKVNVHFINDLPGLSPMACALHHKNPDMVKVLLEGGFEFDRPQVLISIYKARDCLGVIGEVLKIEKSKEGDLLTLLLLNCSNLFFGVLRYLQTRPLYEIEASLNYKDITGSTVLTYAAAKGMDVVLGHLLEFNEKYGGLDLSAGQENQYALALARLYDRQDVISKFVKYAGNHGKTVFQVTKLPAPLSKIIVCYIFGDNIQFPTAEEAAVSQGKRT